MLQALRKVPWWVAFLFSVGIGGMNTFAGSVLSPPVQVLGFAVSAALFLFAVIAACWHYGLHLRKRLPLYVSHVRERLPLEGPRSPFRVYHLLDTEPPMIAPGLVDCSGPIEWPDRERPMCERVEITNHSDETLVNVAVNIALDDTSPPVEGKPPAKSHLMAVEFEQVRSGETATAYIVSAARLTITGKPVSAFGTPINGKRRELNLHTKTLSIMVFYPPKMLEFIDPQKAVEDRHKEILKALPPLLATVQEQALTYGQCNLAEYISARFEADSLVSEIPYDKGTVETVRDFLQACAIAAEKHDTAAEHRQAREDVARIAPGLFRQLHQGAPIDRAKVDLPDWCRREDTSVAEKLHAKQQTDRRALIASGRDLVQRYRDEKMPEPFGAWVAKQRPYLDLRPHLGIDYLRERTIRAERPDTPTKRDWDSGEFERELARLEKGWGL